MTTAFDLRQITPTQHGAQVTISINDNVTPYAGTIDVICGDLSLQVTHQTILRRGLATTHIDSVHAYLTHHCLIPFELPADLDVRLINTIEAYFELQVDRQAFDMADECRTEARLEREAHRAA